jgi:hypothetical protein
MMHSWTETYEGDSPQAEGLAFQDLAREIMTLQLRQQKCRRSGGPQRAFHAKGHIGVENAVLRFLGDLPRKLQVGYVQPGRAYPVTVRFSNASGLCRSDRRRDMRGVALRVKVDEHEYHDLLAANFPVSHVRDARQFVAFAKAMAGPKILTLPRLLLSVGPSETGRILRNLAGATAHPVHSLALETYWSRSAVLWGRVPVRYLLRPSGEAINKGGGSKSDPHYLHHEIADRLRQGDVSFDLSLQAFVDSVRTPIEDAAVEWNEEDARPVRIATLTIPRQDIDSRQGRAAEQRVDQIAFNPWLTTDAFRPLGNLNRARKAVYMASSSHRLGHRFHETVPLRNVIGSRVTAGLFRVVNRYREWHELDWRIGLLNLAAYRDVLRSRNLIDTQRREAPPRAEPVPGIIPEVIRTTRTHDGRHNDMSDPHMGAVGWTFGRNMSPVHRPERLTSPDPICVSRQLLHREALIPAKSLNLLAASWIQFQVHDWVNHARHKLGKAGRDIVLPMPHGETWRNRPNGPPSREMRIAGNKISGRSPAGYPTFANRVSHWWDGSELYGSHQRAATALREGAFIRLTEDRYLPQDLQGDVVTGFNESWWLGLSLMHTLFAREHNVVCEALRSRYVHWNDEKIYQTARLIVSALIAKIHTVEWTPAILATRAIEEGLPANWYGAPKDWLTQLGVWLIDAHALKGIPQTFPNHHTAPYSLTEEFVAVYRMHPLIPDEYRFYDHAGGEFLEACAFGDIQGRKTDDQMRRLRLSNVIYSFGIAHPGAVALHNYPQALRTFELNGERIDLAVVDLVRDRKRGVPRYNDFRAALHKPRLRDWRALTDRTDDIDRLKDLYGSIDRVDTMVGLFAERRPEALGFSDTAFRVFILMASRRLQSDRFLTIDFSPEVYSPLGLDWIARNGMTSIILRHCPGLARVLRPGANAFKPFGADA